MRNLKHLIIFLCLCCICPLHAQEGQKRSTTISLDDISCFQEDANGMLWIATNNGLIRYNGTFFYKLTKTSAENSIPDNFINDMIIDHQQRIFISTNGGLCLYDFEKFLVREERKEHYMPTYAIADKDDKSLFVLTDKGLELMDKETLTRTTLFTGKKVARSLHAAVNNQAVIAVSNTYQHAITFLKGDYKRTSGAVKAQRPKQIISDKNGDFWFLDNLGLHFVSGSTLQEVPLPNWIINLKGKTAYMLQAHDLGFYIGIPGDGVYNANTQRHTLTKQDYNMDPKVIGAGFVDSHGNFWAKNTTTTELNFHSRKSNIYINSYDFSQLIHQHGGISNMIMLAHGNFLVHTYDNTIIQYLSESQQANILQNTDKIETFYGTQDNLWAKNNSLNQMAKVRLEGNHLTKDQSYEFGEMVMNVHVVNGKYIWAIHADSVTCVSPQGILSFKYPGKTQIRNSYQNKYDNLIYLVSLEEGIFQVQAGGTCTQVFENAKYGISNSKFLSIDKNGNYWIGTISDGLYKYDVKTQELTHFDTSNGLSDNSIIHLVDAGDYLMVATLNGLNAINIKTEQIRRINFGKNKLDNKYLLDSGFLDEDGTVYFATENGIIHVNPNQLEKEPNIPFYLESILVNNESLGWVSPTNEFHSSIVDTHKTLSLAYDRNNLEFTFCAIDYENSDNLLYSYRLIGLEKEWTTTQNNTVNFLKLPAGKYHFEARVMNESNEWSEPISLTFRINPPFWWSIWAKLLYLILILGATAWGISLYARWQLNRKNMRFMEQDSLVNKRMSEMKINFFTNISHEFRTPLTLITSPLKQLKEEERPEEKAFLYGLIERNVQKMLRLTEDLLKYNRRESFQPQLDLTFGSLSDFLQETISIFQFNADLKDITIQPEHIEETDCSFDAPKLNDILSNLLTNAIKYSPRHKAISVSMKQIDATAATHSYGLESTPYAQYIEICVKDQGIGISDEQKENIFHRYERVEGTEELTGAQGFGIGLHYTRQLIEFLEGSIRVTDNPQGGSIFSFIIPFINQEDNPYEAHHATQTGKIAKLEKFQEKKVLIVEDDVDMRVYLERRLSDYYTVESVDNGQACLDYLRENDVDLIICDRMMPVMDGDTLCKNLKGNQENQNLPIIMLTAKTDRVSKIQGINLGVDAYITKPFDLDYLLANINNLLEKRMQIQEQIKNFTLKSMDDEENKEAVKTLSHRDEEFLTQLYNLIDQHMHEPDFKINSLYTEMAMSHTKFYTKIKNLTGTNPSNLYMSYRMNKALEMLKSKDFTISEIADKTGFSTLASFSRAFKDYFGTAPTKYE